MARFEKENALIISGGRNDKLQVFYSDIYLLGLHNLTWTKIESYSGFGLYGLSDHIILPITETDFLVLGGTDSSYKLSNRISIFTFAEPRIWAYSHNCKTVLDDKTDQS